MRVCIQWFKTTGTSGSFKPPIIVDNCRPEALAFVGITPLACITVRVQWKV